MDTPLPQFQETCRREVYCAVCLIQSVAPVHRAVWRKRYDGVPQDDMACWFGKEWLADGEILKPYSKPSPEEVERRSQIPCKLRTENGECTICGCGIKKKACSAMAAIGPCPSPEPKW